MSLSNIKDKIRELTAYIRKMTKPEKPFRQKNWKTAQYSDDDIDFVYDSVHM